MANIVDNKEILSMIFIAELGVTLDTTSKLTWWLLEPFTRIHRLWQKNSWMAGGIQSVDVARVWLKWERPPVRAQLPWTFYPHETPTSNPQLWSLQPCITSHDGSVFPSSSFNFHPIFWNGGLRYSKWLYLPDLTQSPHQSKGHVWSTESRLLWKGKGEKMVSPLQRKEEIALEPQPQVNYIEWN